MRVPNHVAIILDGNGRWAKAKGKPRSFGHKAGAENVEVICRAADKLGIKYLTMYAFSTENWNRPEAEVATLMKLLLQYMKYCEKNAKKDNMRVRIIGDTSKLSEELRAQVRSLEENTSAFTGLQFNIAINYGSRDEMLRAMRRLSADVAEGKRSPAEIDEATFSSYLDTKELPDPDLLIRTSGEERLSNFLLWQLAYSEFYFTDVPWPDFSPEELKKAVEEYDRRDRRFGGVKTEEA